MTRLALPLPLGLLLAFALGAGWQAATAQPLPPGVYKSTQPNGRVVYSDIPLRAGSAEPADAAANPGTAALPLALRQALARYPVVLYTAPQCGPCDQARAYLQQRGVPYGEKSVTSNADIAALTRLAGDATVPFATLGQQALKGFSADGWASYLDAAGYPGSAQLPTGYRFAAATPLTARAKPLADGTAAPTAGAAGDVQAPSAPPLPAATPAPPPNPAGIRF